MNLNKIMSTHVLVRSALVQHATSEIGVIDTIRKSSSHTLQQRKRTTNDSFSIINSEDSINRFDRPDEFSPKVHKQKDMSRLVELRKRLQSDDPRKVKLSNFSAKQSADSIGQQQQQPQTPPTSWRDVLATARKLYGEEFQQEPNSSMLTDSFSRRHSYLRISLGERCNLRCLYCMPHDGVPLQPEEKLLKADEIDRLVALFTAGGVNKVRLTGGEPLLRQDLPQIVASIASRPNMESVGITTNGITLSRHLPSLVEAGLTHANISLDTLNDSKFVEITRRKGLAQVLRSIEDACAMLPEGNVKINCVVMKGFNDVELRDFVYMSKVLPVDIRFIEWMPFNDNGWNKDRFFSYNEMMKRITSDDAGEMSSLKGLGPFELRRLVDGANDTTKWWQVAGHEGRLGFITSMTEHFCGTCNRVRLTADGQLKVCLFGSTEVSLRDAMREGANDADLALIVRAALQKKKFALGGHGNAEGIKKANDNRPMILIGG
mmetsp:Transcript_8295/g.15628  ORF Transcript_8295/g.15628 Transcript_8295/m.15628 type:complete len:490 (-) Transcript_8295:65-1534(-)